MSVLLADVAEALARAGALRCELRRVDLTATSLEFVVFVKSGYGAAALSLHDDLRYVADVASVREFAARYGIDPGKLEAFIGKGQGKP